MISHQRPEDHDCPGVWAFPVALPFDIVKLVPVIDSRLPSILDLKGIHHQDAC
jgi:hypothetical protein